jgi:glucosamine--fructose-6-phosphate aminotransferase (isomerizing)
MAMLGQWMEQEILDQPRILREQGTGYFETAKQALGGKTFEMILLAARGSSDHAALFARYLIEIHLKRPVSLAAPSVLTRYGVQIQYPATLAIGISQSGSAPDVAEVLSAMREAGHGTLAITNTEGSRLTQEAEHSILLGAEKEKSVAATKTYLTSLLALIQVVRALGADLPDPMATLPTDEWCAVCREAARAAAGQVDRANPVFALARGYQFSTACETALKLMECALLPCKAYSTSDFEHGPKALADRGSASIVYEESVDALAKQGTQVVLAPSVPSDVPMPFRPLWSVIFGQFLALEVARLREEDPDKPQFIQKVTETF